MKQYAQIGFGLGKKLEEGLREGIVDGGIFSPKDMKPDSMKETISHVRGTFPDADMLVDPQFYVSPFIGTPDVNVGYLAEWDYFRGYRKSDLEISATVRKVLGGYYHEIADWDVTAIIAPNVYIAESLDSREAVIAKNFMREAKDVYGKLNDKRPLYASLVVCREALQDRREFEEFMNDITMLDNPPDGVYLIVAGRTSSTRSELFHTDVLANWMLLNLSLSVNGLGVINGYCDLAAPLLGLAGGAATATGWFSNLRVFSMERFFPAAGGRQPIPRYLSKLLLNRVTFSEKEAIARFLPAVVNGLPHDGDYDPDPERQAEALQSWEALRSLLNSIVGREVKADIKRCRKAVQKAKEAYAGIARRGVMLDARSRDDHLVPLEEALDQFEERAELR